MKRILIIALLGLTSCGTIEPRQAIQDSLPYLPTATSIAAGLIVNLSVSDVEKRQEVYDYMYTWAVAVRSLSGGQAPTVDQFKEIIGKYAPSQAGWADVATALSSVYATYYPSIQGDPKLALQVLEAIAKGCEQTAEKVKGLPNP
jgi:hypothetical protein